MPVPSPIRRMAAALVLAGSLAAVSAVEAPGQPKRTPIQTAYFEGEQVRFTVVPAGRKERRFQLGPWDFGVRVSDNKPRDRRYNLYLVAPGKEHTEPGWEEFDHNSIVNSVPVKEEPVEWDVFWVIVLDPALDKDLNRESDLLIHAQEAFEPAADYTIESAPGRVFLKHFLKANSLEDLAEFRRKDGSLPRILIVPAKFAVRATAERLEPTEPVEATATAIPEQR